MILWEFHAPNAILRYDTGGEESYVWDWDNRRWVPTAEGQILTLTWSKFDGPGPFWMKQLQPLLSTAASFHPPSDFIIAWCELNNGGMRLAIGRTNLVEVVDPAPPWYIPEGSTVKAEEDPPRKLKTPAAPDGGPKTDLRRILDDDLL